VKIKMTQAYEKVMEMKSLEIEELQVHIERLLGDLNPKYFEESISITEAKERSHASRIEVGSKFNFFSAF
jgi:hypothetical protein